MRKNGSRKAAAIVGAAALLAAGFAHAPGRYAFTPESRLWVEGSSSVRDYTCEAKQIDGSVVTASPVIALGDLDTAVQAIDLVIPVARLDCNNGTMNDHMRKALKAKEHPEIRFGLTTYTTAVEQDRMKVTIVGELTLAGTTKPIQLEATVARSPEGALTVQGSTSFKMTDWGVKPPSLMLGAMKVRAPVTVHFDVTLREAQ